MIDEMLRGALALCALAGCDVVFDVDRISGSPHAPLDAAIDAFALCGQPFLDDTFDDGTACRPWGSEDVDVGGTVSESNGSLVIQPAPNMVGSRGGCRAVAAVPFGPGGIAVEVSHAITGTDAEFTILAVEHLAITVANGKIVFDNDIGTITYGGPLVYVPAQMRWWRLRPQSASVVAEYSADGARWTPIGELLQAPPTQANFSLFAGLNYGRAAQANPQAAVYDRLIVCP